MPVRRDTPPYPYIPFGHIAGVGFQTLPPNTPTVVAWTGTPKSQNGVLWDAANNAWTIYEPGYYQIVVYMEKDSDAITSQSIIQESTALISWRNYAFLNNYIGGAIAGGIMLSVIYPQLTPIGFPRLFRVNVQAFNFQMLLYPRQFDTWKVADF